MDYREQLPIDCPPEEATQVEGFRIVFRLIREEHPTLDDFQSQRAEQPLVVFQVNECQARGLSVFADKEDAVRARRYTKLHNFRICRVELTAGAGAIMQTGRRSHHTWWPLARFDILANCQMEQA